MTLVMSSGQVKTFAFRQWSDEDGAFIAQVPELSGCAGDGATKQEVLANAELVIGEWLETARALGRPVPEPKGRLLFA